MSESNRSGSTGKSVSRAGAPPGETTNRSCFPAASHRNATVFPSGDQVGLVGYLMFAIRSMVMLPRGGSAAAGDASVSRTVEHCSKRVRVISPPSEPGGDAKAEYARCEDARRTSPGRADLLVLQQHVVRIERVEQVERCLQPGRVCGKSF